MAKLLRVACMVVLLVGTALAAAFVQPEWSRDLGLDRCGPLVPENGPRGRSKSVTGLDEGVPAIQRRIRAKARVVDELIDGRLTLFEAAALFRRLNDPSPASAAHLARDCPGDSEEERLCRQVIAWVRVTLPQRPADVADEMGARFEEELREHKECHGVVILPDAVPER